MQPKSPLAAEVPGTGPVMPSWKNVLMIANLARRPLAISAVLADRSEEVSTMQWKLPWQLKRLWT
eukprot:15163091-Heterocapsa_arctica.AAC.1